MKSINSRSTNRTGVVELKKVALIMFSLLFGFVSAVSIKSIQKRKDASNSAQHSESFKKESFKKEAVKEIEQNLDGGFRERRIQRRSESSSREQK